MIDFMKLIRPELTPRTLNMYTKEYRYLAEVYEEEDPYELTSILVDVAEHEMNLDHIRLGDNKYLQDIRLLVFRSLYLFFTTLHNENIDLLISEIFI